MLVCTSNPIRKKPPSTIVKAVRLTSQSPHAAGNCSRFEIGVMIWTTRLITQRMSITNSAIGRTTTSPPTIVVTKNLRILCPIVRDFLLVDSAFVGIPNDFVGRYSVFPFPAMADMPALSHLTEKNSTDHVLVLNIVLKSFFIQTSYRYILSIDNHIIFPYTTNFLQRDDIGFMNTQERRRW